MKRTANALLSFFLTCTLALIPCSGTVVAFADETSSSSSDVTSSTTTDTSSDDSTASETSSATSTSDSEASSTDDTTSDDSTATDTSSDDTTSDTTSTDDTVSVQATAATLTATATSTTSGASDPYTTSQLSGSSMVTVTDIESGVYKIVSAADGTKAVTVQDGSLTIGSNVDLETDTSSDEQLFYVENRGDGTYEFTSIYSGQVLDVTNFGTEDCSNVEQYPSYDTSNQHWTVKSTGNGDNSFYLVGEGSAKVLDAAGGATDGANIQIFTNWGNANQTWQLVEASVSQSLSDGVYSVANAADGTMTLDMAGYSNTSGTNVQVFPYAQTANQSFRVTHLGNNRYKITAIGSGTALDVVGYDRNDGANVQLYDDNGTENQEWIIEEMSDGTYAIIGVQSCRLLSTAGSSTDACTNVQMAGYDGSTTQYWTFTSQGSQPISNGTYNICSDVNTGYTLDVAGYSTDDCANVQVYPDYSTSNQAFTLTYVGGGYYTVVNQGSGKALDAAGFSGTSGTNVQQFTAFSTCNQLWRFEATGDGSYIIYNGTGDELALTAAKPLEACSNVSVETADGSNMQQWVVEATDTSKWIPGEDYLSLSPTTEQTIEDGVYTISSAMSSSLVLDVVGYSTESGANVQTYTFAGTTNQRWSVTYLGSGLYKILSLGSGLALSADASTPSPCTNVDQETYTGADQQTWYIADAGDGYYYILNGANATEVVDIAGAYTEPCGNVQTYLPLEGGSNQEWCFTRLDYTLDAGYFEIESALDTSYVLDAAGYSFDDESNVQLFTDWATGNQKWAISDLDGDGSYTITNGNSGLALDGAGGEPTAGANVQQFTNWETDNQLWSLVEIGNGYFYIMNNATGLFLTVDGSAADGANVYLDSWSGSTGQQFKLSATSLTKDQFFDSVGHWAQQEYRTRYANGDNWVLPSVSIGQAALESAYGASDLCISGKALYGIKATSSWTGKTYSSLTQEELASGSYTTITASFRAYRSIRESVGDYYELICDWDHYSAAWNQTDYTVSIQAIKDAGYATDSSYVTKVESIVDTYDLTQYDTLS
jgi:flagellum-specific peptidoglycan hydrolase FlgJ